MFKEHTDTQQSSTEKFIMDCHSAISNYRLSKKKVPEHREEDLLALRDILMRYESYSDIVRDMQQYFTKMKTGWWIFKTGNSHLKDLLVKVIDDYNSDFQRDTYDLMHYSLKDLSQLVKLQAQRIEFLEQDVKDKEKCIMLLQSQKAYGKPERRVELLKDWETLSVSGEPLDDTLTLNSTQPIAIKKKSRKTDTLTLSTKSPARLWSSITSTPKHFSLTTKTPSIQAADEVGETLSFSPEDTESFGVSFRG